MLRSAISLECVTVASPCQASWEDMEGDERVRFCGLCQRNVYSLSGMDRSAAEGLVRKAEGRLCVRFYRRADGTVLTEDCPVGLERALRHGRRLLAGIKVAYAAGIALLLGGLLLAAAAPAAPAGKRKVADVYPLSVILRWFRPAPPPVVMGEMCIPIPPALNAPPALGEGGAPTGEPGGSDDLPG
jgi:hypothetical protein